MLIDRVGYMRGQGLYGASRAHYSRQVVSTRRSPNLIIHRQVFSRERSIYTLAKVHSSSMDIDKQLIS